MRVIRGSLEVVLLGTVGSLGPSAAVAAEGGKIDVDAVEAFVAGQLREGDYPSLSVGVVRDQELVFARAYGLADRENGREATADSLYRIGSITKVFTATLLCMLRDEGVLRLDDPVSKYLPDSVKLPGDPRGAPHITLRHLATHASGLPRQPVNLTPDGDDVYAGYTVSQLYEGLGRVELAFPTGSRYQYSNLGFGLLGHVLERAAGRPYEELLKERLLTRLGMMKTGITLSQEQQALVTIGYRGDDLQDPAPVWDLGCLAGAGALVSSVPDLAKFVALQMRAGQADVQPVSGGTLTELRTPQRLTERWKGGVGLGWHVNPTEGIGDVVWHNGGVAGHYSFLGFNLERKLGVIVLTNGARSVDGVAAALLALVADAQTPRPATATAEALPSGAEILDRFVEATGGIEPRKQVRNIILRGKANLAGMPAEFEIHGAEPARHHLRMWAGPRQITEEGTDGDVVWRKALGSGVQLVQGDERELVRRGARLHADTEWRELYRTVRCTGVVEFAGRRCHKVVLTPRKGGDEIRYYDAVSHLLAGMEITLELPGLGEQTIQETHDDYREVDGILYAHQFTQKVAGVDTTMTVERILHNQEIPENTFALPPEVRRLLKPMPTTESRPAAP